MDILADDLSRDTLNAYLRLRTRDDTSLLEKVTRSFDKQYFDDTVFAACGGGGVFVDMGALDGASSIQFTEWVEGNYNGILLFEPDTQSYALSKKNISHLKNAIIYNEAASDFCGEINFDNRNSGSSCVSAFDEGVKIATATLDSKLHETSFVPTYIKMDIEGSEAAALRGCEETIRKHKPALAVCIYHKASDIWDIPIWIHQVNPDYKLYIRHYDTRDIFPNVLAEKVLSWELVCYATV